LDEGLKGQFKVKSSKLKDKREELTQSSLRRRGRREEGGTERDEETD
jgi:hypothetical protein